MSILDRDKNGKPRRSGVWMMLLVLVTAALAGCAADEGEEAGGDEQLGEEDGLGTEDEDVAVDEEEDEDAGTTPDQVELFITAHNKANDTDAVTEEEEQDIEADKWFEVEELEGPNPRIALAAGQTVTVHFENLGTVEHELVFGGPINASSGMVAPGDVVTFSFEVPEDPDSEDDEGVDFFEAGVEEEEGDEDLDLYFDPQYINEGMFGELEVVDTEEEAFGGDGGDTVGETGEEEPQDDETEEEV